ncbi:MAG: hypothetical protein BWY40_00844 [bacterium ADurb.Bin270]|nr:MAG: hypothetical protein BWY40_00844 [bacterium ADurb.Bin270]
MNPTAFIDARIPFATPSESKPTSTVSTGWAPIRDTASKTSSFFLIMPRLLIEGCGKNKIF